MKKSEWGDWPNFSYAEMECRATGENKMEPSFMDNLQRLRTQCGFPFPVSSAFRGLTHPVELAKVAQDRRVGSHCYGIAADILVSGGNAHRLLSFATQPDSGFQGFGISQSGPHDRRFIHLDSANEIEGFSRPMVWSYKWPR